ncbi:MAG: TIR domain-containing protein [Oscillatoriophycideae cyanobacterium NC_groundwater_1537_Pr4_S-0.65um_50_18]|nr:TIR domain-containing protein [Oscillatoriophycideae cyanobacterium NC_groundwater_1537_Pr4_S-0.65um_50_18]
MVKPLPNLFDRPMSDSSEQRPSDSNSYEYDVFISYSTQDKGWVRGELLTRLQDAGLKVWIDFKDVEIGAPALEDLAGAANQSRKTLLVITPNYLKSKWTSYERYLLQAQDPRNENRRLIPILKEACDVSASFGFLNYVNFTIPDEIDIAWTQLLTALGKPPAAPLPQENTPRQWLLAHPYGMSPHFTGRVAERQMLSNWLNQDSQHPLLVLRALGGFGKSALTWYWLLHDINRQQWRQVVWWSFYEPQADFNAFMREALTYLSDREPGDMPPRQQLDQLLDLLSRSPILLVMDGFERELRAYSSMGAAYQGDELERTGHQTDRDCINPHAERFLHDLSSLPQMQGKVLMTTRLRPRPVELTGGTLLQGCREEELTQMQPADAVAFFRSQGIRGNRTEIETACADYGYHPLSLRLLSGLVVNDFRNPGDIKVAQWLEDLTGDLVQRQHHVLEQSYQSLVDSRRQLLSRIACFRSPVDLNILEAITKPPASPEAEPQKIGWFDRLFNRSPQPALRRRVEPEDSPIQDLQADLQDLIDRGLLHYDRSNQRFDLHPIVRRYAYDRMGNPERTSAHQQLRDHFIALPAVEKVQTLADLTPVIELYHHMVRSGQYDEAFMLFRDRIVDALYFQLGAYALQIELLRALFPQGEDYPPQLQDQGAQAWALNALANSYSLNGQPTQAVPLFEQYVFIGEKREDKTNWAIGLGNLASMAQLPIGALQAAEANLHRSIAHCQEIEDEFDEAVGHQELGRLLAYWGMGTEAEAALGKALELFEKGNAVQAQGVVWAYRSLNALLQVRIGDTQAAATALAAAEQSLQLADETALDKRYVYPVRDYVRSHWLLGAAHRVNGNLEQSDHHLSEALTRDRAINMVDHEADILLDLARLRVDQGQPEAALGLAAEAEAIAERSGYVLQGADVQLFLAEQALARGERAEALKYAQKARQLATCDGGEYTYKVTYEAAGRLLQQLKC